MTDEKGRELIEHGTTQLPVACYHDNLADTEVPWHWHEELEIAIITEGTALVGGSLDSIFWQKYLYPLMQNPSLKGLSFDQHIDWHQKVLRFIETAWQSCVQETSGYEFRIRTALSEIIYLLSTNSSSMESSPSEKALRNGARIKQMLQYIHDHFTEELNTARIAEAAMISESECLRCFHNTVGTTPIQYLKQFRIRKAAALLTETSEKITNIGIQCGFQEMSYFSKSFRQIMGCTPREYRNRK